MATIAERLIGGAQRTAEQTGAGLGAGLTQLGDRIQAAQQGRQLFG